jgi:hypothetical protein
MRVTSSFMHLHKLVENIAKKNRSHFPIAVSLITMICSRIFAAANLKSFLSI